MNVHWIECTRKPVCNTVNIQTFQIFVAGYYYNREEYGFDMPVIYPASRGFSLAWLLQFTKSFACLVCRVVGFVYTPREKPLPKAARDFHWACVSRFHRENDVSLTWVTRCRGPYFFVGKNFCHQFAFSFAFEMSRLYPRFSPKKFTSSSSGTPNKAINAANQFCLVCDCDLRQKAQVVVYFNVRSCPGLQRVIGRDVKTKESHRICRKCKQKIDVAIKKVEAADRVFNWYGVKDSMIETLTSFTGESYLPLLVCHLIRA